MTKRALITQEATFGQLKQISRLGTDGIDRMIEKMGLTKEQAQRIIENNKEFVKTVELCAEEVLKKLALGIKYDIGIEVETEYGYASGYRPKPLAKQFERLKELFPHLNYPENFNTSEKLPEYSEGWFAIPKWNTIAPVYGEAVAKVLEILEKDRGRLVQNTYHPFEHKKIIQSKRSIAFQEAIYAQSDNDFVVIPAQFGIRHRGRNHVRSQDLFIANEYGLGTFEVAIMLLTHPERLKHHDDLWVGCPGDEYSGPFSGFSSTSFNFYLEHLELKLISSSDDTKKKQSSVTAFIA